MPMMLAKGASIISIIGGPFLHFWPPMHPSLVKIVSHPKLPLGLGASFQKRPVLMMHIWGVLGGPQKCLKNPSVPWGFAVGAQVNFGAVSGWGREGPGEKRRSDDAPARGVGGIGATPYRAKALEWTGSALDHGGVAGF